MRLRGEMLDEYRRLIPEVPNIGGRRNINAMPMTIAPYALALYRIVVRHGGSVEDTGELLHAITQSQFDRIPRMLRHWVGRQ